jgi:hypothetical protein
MFVERRSRTVRGVLLTLCGSLLVPSLGAVLVIREQISLAGFVAMVVAGVVATFFVNDWLDRRNQTVREVRPARKPKGATANLEPMVFPEALGLPLLITVSVALIGFAVAGSLLNANGVNDPKRWTSPLSAIPAMIIVFIVWASQTRLVIEGNEVRTFHPWLRLFQDRVCRFSDIDTVETRDIGRGGWQVTIKPHDGASVVYRSSDRTRIDALVSALSAGVARTKPSAPDLEELL